MPATPERIAKITQKSRIAAVEDVAIKTSSTAARDMVIVSLLIDGTAADNETLRQFNLLKKSRDVFEISCAGLPFNFKIGQTINLRYPRFNLENGKEFIIIGIEENFSEKITNLKIWG